MKRFIWLAMLVALAVAQSGAQAQLVTPGGGSGAAGTLLFTNGPLPISSATAASQCLETNAGGTAVILGSCGGGGSYPAGSPPQFGGFSALNTSEAETLGGDATFTRAGANSYTENVLGLHFGASNAVTLPSTPPTSGGIPYFSSAGAISSSAALTANKPVIGGGAGVAPSVGTTTGNTTAFATSTGTLTSGDCAKWDASGNIIDNGSACGGGGGAPIFVHTQTAGTAGTLTVNSTTAAIDTFYMSPTGALTETTDTAAHMGDGEQIVFRSHNAGTAWTVTFAAGVGVTLKTIVPGDTGAAGAVCVPPATGDTWYRFQWDAALGNLTLLACGPNPPAVMSVAQGGTGASTLTAHSVLVGEGTSAVAQVGPGGTAGQVLTQATTAADPTYQSRPYDVGFSISGTPAASQVFPFVCTRTLNFPANLSSSTYPDTTSQASCGTNPAESDAYLLKVNTVTQCTLTLNTSCALAVTTCTSTWTCTAGQRLELDAPATVSGSNIAFTIAGHTP